MGFLFSRKRPFGVLTLNEIAALSADLTAFQEKFKRALCVDGDIFWMAPVEDVLASYEDRASQVGGISFVVQVLVRVESQLSYWMCLIFRKLSPVQPATG